MTIFLLIGEPWQFLYILDHPRLTSGLHSLAAYDWGYCKILILSLITWWYCPAVDHTEAVAKQLTSLQLFRTGRQYNLNTPRTHLHQDYLMWASYSIALIFPAANQIEAAAKRLASLQPRRQPDIDPNLNFEDQILEAAKSIASATAMLVKSASAAQSELVAQVRRMPIPVLCFNPPCL